METDIPAQRPDTPDEIDEHGDDRDALEDGGNEEDPAADESIH